MIEVADIRFRYAGALRDALDACTFTLAPGEAAALTAPTGGGKSTLLKLLASIAPRTTGGTAHGSGRIGGRHLPIEDGDLADLVGYVPQDPHAGSVADRVEDEVAFTAENLGLDDLGARVGSLLEACGIAHLRRRRLATLSGGERQRVQIAAALVADPAVLLLDEPTSQLDPDGVASVVALLARLRAERGVTLLAAEHRLARLEACTDRVVRVGDAAVAQVPAALSRVSSPAAPGERVVGLRGVSVDLDSRRVLEGIDLDLHAGEAVALVGPNGSGKTTLLRTLLGFARPAGGTIRVPERRALAYVPQRPEAAFCRERVRDEVALTLHARRSASRVDEVLEAAGLSTVADRSPRHLSAGERLRVALCALTAGSPQLVVLDEPTRGLDAPARGVLVEAIRSWKMRGAAVLLATHDEELVGVCDRMVRLQRGALAADETNVQEATG